MKKARMITVSALGSIIVILLLTSAGTAVPYVESNSKVYKQGSISFNQCIKKIKSVFNTKINDNAIPTLNENNSGILLRLIRLSFFPMLLFFSLLSGFFGFYSIFGGMVISPVILTLGIVHILRGGSFSDIVSIIALFTALTSFFFLLPATTLSVAIHLFNTGYYETLLIFISYWLTLYDYILTY